MLQTKAVDLNKIHEVLCVNEWTRAVSDKVVKIRLQLRVQFVSYSKYIKQNKTRLTTYSLYTNRSHMKYAAEIKPTSGKLNEVRTIHTSGLILGKLNEVKIIHRGLYWANLMRSKSYLHRDLYWANLIRSKSYLHRDLQLIYKSCWPRHINLIIWRRVGRVAQSV